MGNTVNEFLDDELSRFLPDGRNLHDLPTELVEEQKSIFFHPGKIIAGRFEIVEKLGFSRLGAVYKVSDLLLYNTPCVIKVILPSLVKNHEARERFLHEVNIVRSLRQEGCVTVYDVYEDKEENLLLLSMELLEGKNLSDYLKAKGGKISFREASDIILQICNVLRFAHGKGIIHGGIKPQNIYVIADGKIKLLDFGLAKLLSSEKLIHFSIGFGMDRYISPEQSTGKGAGISSDIFALGIVFYHLLTIQKPDDKFRWPPGIEGIIKKCLMPQPEDRYQDIPSFVQDLEQIRKDALSLKEYSGEESADKKMPVGGRSRTERELPAKIEGSEKNNKQERQKFIGILFIFFLIAVISVLFSYIAIKKYNRSYPPLDTTRLTEQDAAIPETQMEQVAVVDISENVSKSAEQAPQDTPHETVELSKPQQVSIIDSSLEKAEEHMNAQRYTSPPGNNAFASLKYVLAIDPDNKRAQGLVRKIRNMYMTKGEEALRNRDYLIAVTYHQKALYVYPEDPQARKKLEESLSFLSTLTGKSALDAKVFPDTDSKKDIGSLLSEVKEHFKAQRYTSPPGNNAFATLKYVLAIDPDNKRAQGLVRKIRNMYMTKGEEALRNRDYLIAKTYFQKALYVTPGYPSAEKKLRESDHFLHESDF
jgi:serine/threonine protein kinase